MEVLALAAGLMSLVLGGLSIWLSLQFYTKGTDSEKEAAKLLEGIRTQTDALQKLTGRWMDRLTRYATEPRPADEGLMTLVATVANLPSTILSHLQLHAPTSAAGAPGDTRVLVADLVDCYIGLYYYTLVSNLAGQALLPPEDQFDPESDNAHALIQRLVDGSASDALHMESVLVRVDARLLETGGLSGALEEARSLLRPALRSVSEAHAAAHEQAEE